MAAAHTGGYRLVRCPKCLNILPEPPNVSVYKCGGCDATLRAKSHVKNGQNVTTKQVRQDSDNFSVVTSVSNKVLPENKELRFSGDALGSSCTLDTPSFEIEHKSNSTRSNENEDVISTEKSVMQLANTENSNGTRSNENEDVMTAEKSVMQVANTENKEDCSFDGQNANGETEGHADLINPNANGTHIDSDQEEDNTIERSAKNSEACRVKEDDDMEYSLYASEVNTSLSDGRKVAADLPESEQNGAYMTEPVAITRCKLVRVQSRSFDLREVPRPSVDSLDFHSSRTSFQSKSFRASEPLQSKIMKTVDDLKGDLSEIFSKPSDCKAKALPPHPSKQDGYKPNVAVTSSQPLTAYHPTAKHSGYAGRRSMSGQVAPRGLPLPRYRRHSAYLYGHSGQMEMRSCRHECCHSCRPPCYRPFKQDSVVQNPPAMEVKRRPPPRNHCRPVLRAAPFVLCSNCLRLVQLPTEFVIPSKGTRRLRCGSCSEVLSYSYRDPSRKKLQSPFGGDEYSTDDNEIHEVADDQNTDSHQPDPYSYSEEYGLSAGISYSTEDEQPLHVSRNSSFNTSDERSAKESKLHRLMGYSSATELLLHSPDLYESFSRRTPSARRYDRKGKGICVDEDDSGGEQRAMKESKTRSSFLFQGMLKKGIHGLESLKLRS